MHPRTLIIVIASILGVAIGIRTLIGQFGWFPRSEEELLKRATSITVYYFSGGQEKACAITNATEVKELLGLLRIDETQGGHWGARPNSTTIQFMFPGGNSRQHNLFSEVHLGGMYVDRAFTRKLHEIVSKNTTTPVNFFAELNGKQEKF